MSALLEKAASPAIINNAWRKHRRDKAIWRIGVSREEMKPHMVYHLARLCEELKSGNYRPDPVRFFPVSKGDGKERIISAVTLRDKVAQRALLAVLEPMGEAVFHENSFGYRPGRSIDMALAKCREHINCGMEWVVDADIKSYFDEIPHGPLMKRVRALIRDPKVVALIRRWLDVGVPRRGFLGEAKGIPQGSVISPFLCNLYLTDLDRALGKANLPFVRFADDFLVFARTRADAEDARKFVEKTLRRLGLALHPEKTRIAKCGPKVSFLGRKLPKIRKRPGEGGGR